MKIQWMPFPRSSSSPQPGPRGSVREELALLAEIAQAMRDASICGLGQTAASAVESAIRELAVFEPE